LDGSALPSLPSRQEALAHESPAHACPGRRESLPFEPLGLKTKGEPICPQCGRFEHDNLKRRPVWKCKGCSKQFSLTSGTIFHNRKLSVRDILGAIAIFTNGAKGYSALQPSCDLCIDYNTAFVHCHKLPESIALACQKGALSGNVEVDGASSSPCVSAAAIP
jgi:transposase-like protein